MIGELKVLRNWGTAEEVEPGIYQVGLYEWWASLGGLSGLLMLLLYSYANPQYCLQNLSQYSRYNAWIEQNNFSKNSPALSYIVLAKVQSFHFFC